MQPDYSKYTLDELLDVEQDIDKDAYPQRYELVCKLIKAKESDPVEIELVERKEKSSKLHGALFVVALFWFFALYSIIKGEFTLKTYTATFANEPFAFFCGVSFYFGFGWYFLLLYKKQLNKLKNENK